jgi:hypothetical protein
MYCALCYENTPAATWPVHPRGARPSGNVAAADTPELVMFVHPRCPCSRAGLRELEQILARCDGRLRCRIVFVRPASFAAGWERSDTWRAASRIPGARVVVDPEGNLARRFAARASGEVFLMLPDGRVAYHGGLTPGRGHEGDNAGRAAVQAVLAGGTPPVTEAPVFGCALLAGGDEVPSRLPSPSRRGPDEAFSRDEAIDRPDVGD